MSKILIPLLLLTNAIDLATGLPEFVEYIKAYGRPYKEGSYDFHVRKALFTHRVKRIASHNQRRDRLWTAAVNELTDRTDAELAKLRGWRHVRRHRHYGAQSLLGVTSEVVKKRPLYEVNWKKLSMAHDVVNQGGCGSCWAVAAATVLQGNLEIQQNQTRTFSYQQLVNCVPNPHQCGGSGGCQGATVELAMEYVDKVELQASEALPYHARDQRCRNPVPSRSFLDGFRHQKQLNGAAAIGLHGWHKLPENKALPLMLAVMDGLVAISVAATEWGPYSHGIFDGCSKNAIVDHAVVLFGYGVDGGVNYWTIRNSWGRSWGERGFMRLLRQETPEEDEAYCGIDDDPAAGLACKPYPSQVRVCGMCGMLYDSVAVSFRT